MPDMSLSMSLDDRNDDLPRTLRNKSLRTSDEPMQTSASSLPMTDHPSGTVMTFFEHVGEIFRPHLAV